MNGSNGHTNGTQKLQCEPLKNSGSIDHLEFVDVTPIIGREYGTAKIIDILNVSNAEEQLRDLAITICERDVVFSGHHRTILQSKNKSISLIC